MTYVPPIPQVCAAPGDEPIRGHFDKRLYNKEACDYTIAVKQRVDQSLDSAMVRCVHGEKDARYTNEYVDTAVERPVFDYHLQPSPHDVRLCEATQGSVSPNNKQCFLPLHPHVVLKCARNGAGLVTLLDRRGQRHAYNGTMCCVSRLIRLTPCHRFMCTVVYSIFKVTYLQVLYWVTSRTYR